jgi:Zn-dependent peptidase ImmA (M78 family)
MPKAEVALNPEVLSWSMRQAGVDDAELAARCKTTPEAVRSWRSGEALPGKTEFGKLVARLRRPSAFYFLPRPPADDPVVTAFRRPPGSDAGRGLIDKEQTSIRTAERIQKVARWTREQTGRPLAPWPRLGGLVPSEAARRTRKFLDWDVGRQVGARSPSQAAVELRESIEGRGAYVLQLPLTEKGCRGFFLEDEVAPVLAVNSAYTVPARIFSMMHEVGHLVRHEPGFCSRLADTDETERWCERFAAIFLMPEGEFRDYIKRRFVDAPVADLEEVKSLANRFRVSLRAAAFRVEQLGLGVEGLYEEVDAKADFKGSGGFTDDGTKPAVRLREWGESYARTVAEAENRLLLSRADALEYLNVSGNEYREMKARLEASVPGTQG